jgi:hypothetical protein
LVSVAAHSLQCIVIDCKEGDIPFFNSLYEITNLVIEPENLVNNIFYMGKIIFEQKPLNLLEHELKNQFNPNK